MAAVTAPAPPGFKKLDLHIHTRYSACYIDHIRPELGRNTAHAEVLHAAEEAGLDAIAITDHNGGEVIDEMRELARGSGVTIIPGTEISTRGGCCATNGAASAESARPRARPGKRSSASASGHDR